MKPYTTSHLMKPQNGVTAEYLFFLKSERSFYFWHLQEHVYTEVKKRGVFILMGVLLISWEAVCSQLKLFCHFPSAVCQQKERTFGTRSLSAESWQSCWTIRRACLTQRTMMSPPPMTTAPSMNRFDPSLLHHASQYCCFCLAYCRCPII